MQIKSFIEVQPETKIAEFGQTLQNHLKEKLETKLGVIISGIVVIAEINRPIAASKRTLK